MSEPAGTFRWASETPSPVVPTVAELEADGWVRIGYRIGGAHDRRWLMKMSEAKEEQEAWP